MRAPLLAFAFICASCTGNTVELDRPAPSNPDAGPKDTGPILGGQADAGQSDAGKPPGEQRPPALNITYSDTCRCQLNRCCPSVDFEFRAGTNAPFYYLCGDFVACTAPSIGWELFDEFSNEWIRIFSPAVTSTGSFQCAPEHFPDPWSNGVPFPPGGRVRAVALFDSDCSTDRVCETPCGQPFEVISNEIEVPPEDAIDG